jgi:hypothetical protein
MRAAMGERKMKARITRARVMTERMIREKMISIMALRLHDSGAANQHRFACAEGGGTIG